MTGTLRASRDSLFIVLGDTAKLGVAMIGEDTDNFATRGTDAQRAGWMAKELLIATVRIAAGRRMPVWMPYNSKYCSLAALTLSEYLNANVAEPLAPPDERRGQRQAALNFYHATSRAAAPRVTPAWQQTFLANGVIGQSETTYSLLSALKISQAQRIVCIGSGPRVAGAYALAKQLQINITTLDFSKATAKKGGKGDNTGPGRLEQRLKWARGEIRTYRAKSRQDERQEGEANEEKSPALVHLFPPVPLLVFWQLESMLPGRDND
ncbi:hypothetical protein [Massilia rubra]|uniref:Uncharacterized protein n=1 Tax=Massilia rubra TaxID=2607910 RepID=A0ABX0M3G7_9BURK|nr:hypothetical protein [Massilia rubra]NHZ38149.1 hypothetical protein [Massilia rubra]